MAVPKFTQCMTSKCISKALVHASPKRVGARYAPRLVFGNPQVALYVSNSVVLVTFWPVCIQLSNLTDLIYLGPSLHNQDQVEGDLSLNPARAICESSPDYILLCWLGMALKIYRRSPDPAWSAWYAGPFRSYFARCQEGMSCQTRINREVLEPCGIFISSQLVQYPRQLHHYSDANGLFSRLRVAY